MFKGPTGPQSGRTPRSQAESIGTASGGFIEGPEYDITGGHPVTKEMPSQEYKELQLKGAEGKKPADISAPFTIKGQ